LGTPLYLAPERFQGGGQINFKSDIYGVGCIFYEMLHGESPFHSNNYHSLINRIKNDTPEIRKDLPEDFIFFLLGTLEKDP
jgi:serine/threonine protein kinase